MKYLEYGLITILFVLSFIFTNNITDIIKDKDPIMISIKDKKEKNKINKVNAVINDDEIIPGKNGCEVDINKSYKQMKNVNKYVDEMLKYKDIVPDLSINNIYDKYIVSGNKTKRNVAIVIYVKDKLDDISKLNIKLNLFLDSELLKKTKLDNLNNKKIYNGGYNNNYDDTNIEWGNNLIESYNKSSYCLNLDKNNDNLYVCSKNNMHSINPQINGSNIYNTKLNISNGSIIYFDEKNIDKIIYVNDYLNKKGYNVVYLDELLDERSC